MLSDLFTDSNNSNESNESKYNKDCPPAKRKSNNLAGIRNQGATCYLNTLIQTLFLTREFRDNLFSLTENELGLASQQASSNQSTKSSTKVRVILVELQRLFAQLLMLDQDSCSTSRLTDSFGWTNNEELQQHDVQELNRILFAAIEQSLVNTKQAKLIHQLYNGTWVNKIKCLSCSSVFEREEEFLDIPITVQNSNGLKTSLDNSFILRESLTGNNKYKCEKCNNEYKDAEKYCQLKNLPPILTFSLLRFTYDMQTFQRIKEVGCFEFAYEIDLIDYMEESVKSNLTSDYTKYELYSVIIHSGNAYGGHYRTYIKDLDHLGKWTLIEDLENEKNKQNESKIIKQDESLSKEICLICCDEQNDKELLELDYLKYDGPVELLKAFIYNKYKYDSIQIETICLEITKETGMSWNKSFKSKYGPIQKFFKKYDDTFEVSKDEKSVKLKPHDRINMYLSKFYSNNDLIQSCIKEVEEKADKIQSIKLSEEDKAELDRSEQISHWFDFDDSRVTPIFSSKIRKQFEGKESAYMLFYRRKSSKKPNEKSYSAIDQIPSWLKLEISKENNLLQLKREDYETKLNSVRISCYLETDFYLEKNILNLRPEFEACPLSIYIDKRSTNVNNLKELLVKYCTEQESDKPTEHDKFMQNRKETSLNIVFDNQPFYWLLAIRVDTSNNSGRYNYFIKSILSNEDENFFNLISSYNRLDYKPILILSKQFDQWPIGDNYEPIRIVAKFLNDKSLEINEISFTFCKGTQVKEMKNEIISYLFENSLDIMESSLSFNYVKKVTEKVYLDRENYDKKTLGDLNMKNGDLITIESNVEITIAGKNSNRSNQKTIVVNYLLANHEEDTVNFQNHVFNVDIFETISSIKAMALSLFDLNMSECHLRILSQEDSNTLGNYLVDPKNSTDSHSNIFYGVRLYDDVSLSEILETNKIFDEQVVCMLCPGKAPLKSNHEIAIRCTIDKSLFKSVKDCKEQVEVIINLNGQTLNDFIREIVKEMKLPTIDSNDKENYYLKTLDWLGDGDAILNNNERLCKDIQLMHNQTLLITKGKLIPPNHLKVRVWLEDSKFVQNELEKLKINDETTEVSLNCLLEPKYNSLKFKQELIVQNSLRLDELKVLILSEIENCNDIRLRLLKKLGNDECEPRFQKKRCLFEWHKSLKQLSLQNEIDLYVQPIEDEETLNQGIILLDSVQINLATRLCKKSTFKEISWNVNNGATLASLRESIVKAYPNDLQPSDQFKICIAKRIIDRYQWILLKEEKQTIQAENKDKKKKSNATSNQSKSNLRQSPFNLDHGDLIAFTLIETYLHETIKSEDFMSNEDLEFVKKSNITAAELSRLRKEKKKEGEKSNKKHERRPEVGIKIRIDDFNI